MSGAAQNPRRPLRALGRRFTDHPETVQSMAGAQPASVENKIFSGAAQARSLYRITKSVKAFSGQSRGLHSDSTMPEARAQ